MPPESWPRIPSEKPATSTTNNGIDHIANHAHSEATAGAPNKRPRNDQTELRTWTLPQASSTGPADGRDYLQRAGSTEKHKSKRTMNACITCRQSKVKCSGEYPCQNCRKRSLECCFADDGKRVTVSERYLRHLQNQAREPAQPQVGHPPKRGYHVAFDLIEKEQDARNYPSSALVANTAESLHETSQSASSPLRELSATNQERHEWTSPFTLPSMTMRNKENTPRGWIWLAPASTGSFSARLTLMMSKQLHPDVPYDIPLSLDGDVYKFESNSSDGKTTPDLRGIPPLDYSLYLFSTVKFHLSQLFRLFDEDTFTTHMREFYQDAVRKVAECRLWFMQFLLVLALGKAFLSQSPSHKTAEPPGAGFFMRSMSLLPDYTYFWEDPLLAMEVLALAALYLYSVDRKESAYLYVGHAIRIGQLEGLHTKLPEEEIGSRALGRSYDLWWTVYVLDRHLSSSLGLPISIQDSDITTPLNNPKDSSQKDAILSLQVKVSQVLSTILGTLYKSEKDIDKSFLNQTKSILNTMASLARELEEVVDSKFKDSIDSLSRGTLHLTLLYHRCVIFAMRPLLLSVLRARLEQVRKREKNTRNTSTLMNTLVSTGVRSATKTLHVLSTLVENYLLETFLPFDLEFTMGAGILLTIASTLFPSLIKEQAFGEKTHSILDEIIAKGNRIAEVRKSELRHLESLFEELIKQERKLHDDFNQQTRAPAEAAEIISSNRLSTDRNDTAINSSTPALEVPFMSSGFSQLGFFDGENFSTEEYLANFGLSSDNIRSIVDQIGCNDDFAPGNLPNEWIWEPS